MNKYVLLFAVAHTICLVAMAVIAHFLELSASTTPASLFAAAVYAGMRFVQDHKRLPSKSEKRTLVWGSLAASYAISFVMLLAVASVMGAFAELQELARSLPALYWVGMLMFVSLFYVIALHISYGWFTRMVTKQIVKDSRA